MVEVDVAGDGPGADGGGHTISLIGRVRCVAGSRMGEGSFENGILGKALSADGRRGRRPSA